MPTPDQERMDALSEALAGMLRRQREADLRLAHIEEALQLKPVRVEEPVAEPPLVPEPVPGPVPVAAETAAPHPPPLPLETNIGLTIVNRLGVVTLLLGIAFGFKWLVDNQYIGPAGRVELGVLAGFLTLGLADWLWHRGQRIFAQGITATGVGILYLSLYASFGLYHLVPQSFAFVCMCSVTLGTVALALRYESVAIAALGLFGGYLTPLMLSTGEDHPWFLFSYILVLDAGALVLARARDWRLLDVLSFVATWLLYALWTGSHYKPEKQIVATVYPLLWFVLYSAASLEPLAILAQVLATGAMVGAWPREPGPYTTITLLLAAAGLFFAGRSGSALPVSLSFASFWAFYGLWASGFSVNPIGAMFAGMTCAFALFLGWVIWWSAGQGRQPRPAELLVLGGNGAIYFGACYALLNPNYHAWMGLFAVAVAAIHLAVGAMLWRARGADVRVGTPVLLSITLALTFLTLAAHIQFTQYRITMAWAAEAAVLTWIGRRFDRDRFCVAGLVVCILAWFRLAVLDAWIYPDVHQYALLFNARFLTFLIAAIAAWLCALWNREKTSALVEYLGGHVVLLFGLTLEISGWAWRIELPGSVISVETVSVSILYAVYALALVSIGVATRTVVNRLSGLVLLGFVVLKLYLYDVWQLTKLQRISAFVVLGLLLLSTSFLYSRFRALIESMWKDASSHT
jgi:uncharacterized membrane protein